MKLMPPSLGLSVSFPYETLVHSSLGCIQVVAQVDLNLAGALLCQLSGDVNTGVSHQTWCSVFQGLMDPINLLIIN